MSTKLRIFFSSPGDVAEERLLASRTVDRLQVEFAGLLEVEAIFWEHEPLRATASFQEQVPRPSESDIVVLIFWSRLGTRLPAHIVRDDGTSYASGTEFEFEDAVKGHRAHGSPDLLIYRKLAEPLAPLNKTVIERLAQKEALDAFFEKWFGAPDGPLSSAFHSFASPPEFEESLERHLRKLVQPRLQNGHARQAGPQSARPVWTKGSPFRGLDVFGAEHAELFFGRTVAVSEVLNAMRKQAGIGRAFVVVTGMSGVGKSSLCCAGVLPAITRPGVIEGVGVWRSAIVRPGEALGNLALLIARVLLRPSALPQLANDGTSAEELAALVREDPKILPPLIRARLQDVACEVRQAENLAHTPVARLILLVDQLEEIFTVEQVPPAERRLFAAVLSALARSGCVWVLATLRSDFYSRLEETPEILELKEGNGQYDLRPPTAAEIGQIIRYPAQAAGLIFEQDLSTGETLDDILRDAAVTNPGALPLLEFTLQQLFERRATDGVLTHAAYKELAGMEGALGRYAEQVFEKLPSEIQAALPMAMNALVTVGLGAKSVSRRCTPLAALSSTETVRLLVEAFVAARLLVAACTEEGDPIVQFVHEAVLERWPRVRELIEQNKEMLRARSRLSAAATLWSAEKEDPSFLLPQDHVMPAQEILATRRNELSVDEIRYIESSVAMTRATEQKQRRRIRMAASMAATIVIASLAYAYAWIWPYTAYYNNFVKVNGAPQGIGRLNTKDVRARHWSLKIVRKGRFGHTLTMEAVDGYGNCTRDHTITNFIQQDLNPSNTIQGCFWTFDYDGGVVSQETAYDHPAGAEVLRFLFDRKSESSNIYYAKFSNKKGLASSLVPMGTAYVRFTRSKEGLDERVDFLDPSGWKPSPTDQGIYGQLFRYDEHRNVVEITELGEDGEPSSNNRLGSAAFKIIRDSMGSVLQVMHFDVHGQPSLAPDGSFGFRNTYDQHYNLVASTTLDASGSPLTTHDGSVTVARSFNDHGEITQIAFFNALGRPVLAENGYSAVVFRHDPKSLMSEEMYLDVDQNPVALQGCFGFRTRSDNLNRVVERVCLGPNREVIASKAGYAKETIAYNDGGEISQKAFFDAANHPVLTRSGYSIIALHHDHTTLTTDEIYFDINHDPVASNGCFVFRSRSNNLGRIVENVCLGSNREAIASKEGYAKTITAYNDLGEISQMAYFDAANHPVLTKNGYSILDLHYDHTTLTTEAMYFDDHQKPVAAQIGCFGLRSRSDSPGHVVERICLDRNHEPKNSTLQNISIIRYAFDSKRNREMPSFFDWKGRPLTVKLQ